jgi:hypothetical protein
MTPKITFNDVLRAAVAEQYRPPVMQQAPDTAAQTQTRLTKFDAKKVAQMIYDAKGVFLDDEDVAYEAIRQNIKNVKQYAQVTKELQNLTGGRGIGAYLQSFTNINDRIKIVSYLADVIPASQWQWTIKKIVTYADVKSYLGTTNAQKLRSGSGYNKFINNLITNPKLYKSEFDDDAQSNDFRDVSNIAIGTYQTFEEVAQEIRDVAYSPGGIVASVVLEEIPYVNLIPITAYGILLIDDVIKISKGSWDAMTIFDLIFDAMGVASIHPGIMKIVGNMLKGVFKFVLKPAAKLTSKIVRALLEFLLKMSDDVLRFLERIFKTNLRGKLIKTIRNAGKSISSMLEKAGFGKLARIVRRKTAEAELVIVGIYEMYIQPFFQQLYKIIQTIIEFPGKTVEYYLEKLGYTYSKQAGKIVKKGTKVAATVQLFVIAIEKASEWVESQQLKQLKNNQEAAFKQWTEDFSNELRAQTVAITKKTITPVYGLDFKTKQFVYIGNYNASDDSIPMGKIPILARRDRKKNGYIQIEVWEDSSRSNVISTIKLPKTKETSYLFMKEVDIEFANKKPLNSYSWSKGTK